MDATILRKKQKPILQPKLHTDFGEEIPYYDEEFDLMQGDPHKIAITQLLPVFEYIAKEIGKKFLSDQPAWYLDPDTNKQRTAAGDIALSRRFDAYRTTADDLDFVMEVVTTNDKRKEKKDTERMYKWNEYNSVSEFCLYFPDIEDNRVLCLFQLEEGIYREVKPNSNGMLCSSIVPGLCFRELPKNKWTSGHKIELWFQGEEIFQLGKERELRKKAERLQKAAERRAMILAEKLKALGIDPDENGL